MSDDRDDARLRALLADAVDDVRPHDRLGEIRRATRRSPDPAFRARRRWGLVVLGAGTATAAIVAAGAFAGRLGPLAPEITGDADRPAATATGSTMTRAAATYFVGDTPQGPRLFREFQAVARTEDRARLALRALQRLEVDAGAEDPDYRTTWPADSFADVTVGDDWISVEVTDAATAAPDDVAPADLALGVQQVVHTAQAAVESGSLPVAFVLDGRPAATLLGTAVKEVVPRSHTVVAAVSISDPAEGRVTGSTITSRGVVAPAGGALPAEVSWRLLDDAGETVASGTTAVDGRSWDTGPIDLAGVPAGRYVLSASVTLEGPGGTPAATTTDTRTITVR